MPLRKSRMTHIIAAMLVASSAVAAAQTALPKASTPFEEAANSGGLAVVLGSQNSETAVQLTTTGRWLATTLSSDRALVTAQREQFAAKGVAGLATSELRADFKALPFRDGVANMVIVESKVANGPANEELRRIMAPGATLWVRDGNAWRQEFRQTGPLGDWGHEYGAPDKNPISKDTQAGLPTGMQWLSGYGVAMGDPLVADGVFVAVEQEYNRFSDNPAYKAQFRAWLSVRDAASGVLLWRADLHGDMLHRSCQLIHDGRLYWFPGPNKPMQSADVRTGANVRVYDQGASWKLLTKKINNPDFSVWAIVVDGNLIQAHANQVTCLDPATGQVRWTWKTEEPFVNALSGGHDGQIYVGTGKNPLAIVRYYGSREAKELVALNVKDGAVRWRAPVPEGQLGQIISQPGFVAVVCSGHHKWNTDVGYIAIFEAKDGKLRWQKGWDETSSPVTMYMGKPSTDPMGSNAIIRDDSIIMSTSFGTYRLSLADGTRTASFLIGGNQGCQRVNAFRDGELLLATVPTVMKGLWGDPEKITWKQNTLTHLNCAQGFIPSAGRLYARSIIMCGCGYFLRNNQGLAMQSAEIEVPDGARLSTMVPAQPANTKRDATTVDPAVQRAMFDWSMGAYSPLGRIARHAAVPFAIQTDGLTAGTKQDGLTVRCRTHVHMVEAYNDDGNLLWQFQTDARVIADPLIHEGRVYVSGRDGWLYCLDAKTGSMHWRFLAAAADRRMVNSNQVESVWPCLGAVFHDGLIWTAAGQNADLDGGLWVWALDKDGAIKKRARVHQPIIEGEATKATGNKVPANQFNLRVPYYHIYGGGFAAQTVRIHEGQVVLGYRRVKNFGSHPNDAWVYLPVGGEAPAKIVPPPRTIRKGERSDAQFIIVPDEPPAKKP